MGMFDWLYDDIDGIEWQTKAFDCNLENYRLGDRITADSAASYQVEILGEEDDQFVESYATILRGVLVGVDDERDIRLPVLHYDGGITQPTPADVRADDEEVTA